MNSTLKIVFLAAATMLCAMASPAGGRAQDRDPFFPDGPRSVPTASFSPDRVWGRDPFLKPFEAVTQAQEGPKAGPEEPGQKRILTGIIYGKHVRLAIIGGETLREGGMVDGKKLVRIKRRSIVLRSGTGATEVVTLKNFSIRN
jgi:hypothetical protein